MIFKKKVRALVHKTFLDDASRDLMRPSEDNKDQFQGLAIKGHVPAINGVVYQTSSERKEIQKQVIHRSRKIGDKNVDSYFQGTNSLAWTTIKFNGRCDWACGLTAGQPDRQPTRSNSSNHKYDTHTVFYSCPQTKCGKLMQSNIDVFDMANVDHRMKCMHCKLPAKIGEWNCDCNKAWFTQDACQD